MRILFDLFSLALNIWFLLFLHSLPSNDLNWILYLGFSGVIFSFLLNIITTLYAFRKEKFKSQAFRDWRIELEIFFNFVIFLSFINTQNGRLLTSEIFGLAVFSAPMSQRIETELKFFSLSTTIFSSAIVLFCQIYSSIKLETVLMIGNVGLIFNGILVIMNLFTKFLVRYQYRGSTQFPKSSSSSKEVELVETNRF